MDIIFKYTVPVLRLKKELNQKIMTLYPNLSPLLTSGSFIE